MQVNYNLFKSTLYVLHNANIKHNNIHIFTFAKARAIILAYIATSKNYKMQVTIKQLETINACIALNNSIVE